MTDPAIEIEHVAKRLGAGQEATTVLDGLSARISTGRVTGLVGPDGAGKTSLMRLVAGLLRPDEGSIRVLGMDSVRGAREIQASIGYMPQRFGLYEDLSVAENLDLYADLHGLTGEHRRRQFDRLMRFTGLGPFRRRLAGRLSGGMKQKLGLACTLISRPRLLLLDEPSVGVDPVSRRELWAMVNTLAEEGVSVLWSTAYLDEAGRRADVLLLSQGRLLASGPPERLSEKLGGRTYRLQVDAGRRRAALRRAQETPEVLDAIVKGHDLRLLLAEGADPSALHGLAAGEPEPVSPGFEDAFVALLKESHGAGPAAGRGAGSGKGAAESAPARGAADAMLHDGTAEAADSPVIEVADLSRDFGAFRAVDRISFEVTRGEIFGLLGPNGAGKSTTFKMLCGLLPPSSGKARVLGIDLRRAAALARARIGYMAQKFSLYGNMSVLQNLRFFASAYGLEGRARATRIEWAFEEFDLGRYRRTNGAALPLGYKQRLALACAIMHRPGILFLDEPTAGVDPLVRREFWRRINAMAASGVTVMVTTHFMEEAEYCDRVGIIYRGRMIAMGAPDALKAEHATPDRPDPTLEDAFVDLIEGHDRETLQ